MSVTNKQPTPPDDESFHKAFSRACRELKGTAASDHLGAGRPIFYTEPDTPKNHVIKEYPDGQRELLNENDVVVKVLDAV
jgi:hypothetical protein